MNLIFEMKTVIALSIAVAVAFCQSPQTDPAFKNLPGADSLSLAGGKAFLDSVDSQFMQILYDMALLDTFDCVNSGLALNEHLVDSFKALKTMDISTALLNLGLLVHKSPVAYQYCWRIFDDAKSLLDSFGTNFTLPDFLVNTGFNTVINFAEIYTQWGKGIDALQVGNYTTFG